MARRRGAGRPAAARKAIGVADVLRLCSDELFSTKKRNIKLSIQNFGSTSPARCGFQNLQENQRHDGRHAHIYEQHDGRLAQDYIQPHIYNNVTTTTTPTTTATLPLLLPQLLVILRRRRRQGIPSGRRRAAVVKGPRHRWTRRWLGKRQGRGNSNRGASSSFLLPPSSSSSFSSSFLLSSSPPLFLLLLRRRGRGRQRRH